MQAAGPVPAACFRRRGQPATNRAHRGGDLAGGVAAGDLVRSPVLSSFGSAVVRSRANLDQPQGKKPSWIRVQAPGGENYVHIKETLRERGLHTVCEEARCPNLGECWRGGTATFMLLGDTCTRACAFCAVKTGNPKGVVDAGEPEKVAAAVGALKLRYVVLTTVDRDDLADGGAAHYAATVRAIRTHDANVLVEVLTGDFRGDDGALRTLLASEPDVFAHNLEVVERLSPIARDRRASYRTSLDVLAAVKRIAPQRPTKSSLMVGLGETEDELVAAMRDLRAVDVDFLTIGQYLRPSPLHLPVVEFVEPDAFARLRVIGEQMGFRYVASGPLVRSSYKAAEHFIESTLRGERRVGGTQAEIVVR
ncbi:MAG: lipoyl synthase [Planctomycetes bacterium]|nr:lipoyl synthase [Planctomycetota bacterium]